VYSFLEDVNSSDHHLFAYFDWQSSPLLFDVCSESRRTDRVRQRAVSDGVHNLFPFGWALAFGILSSIVPLTP
jgi:hypothetical protein